MLGFVGREKFCILAPCRTQALGDCVSLPTPIPNIAAFAARNEGRRLSHGRSYALSASPTSFNAAQQWHPLAAMVRSSSGMNADRDIFSAAMSVFISPLDPSRSIHGLHAFLEEVRRDGEGLGAALTTCRTSSIIRRLASSKLRGYTGILDGP